MTGFREKLRELGKEPPGKRFQNHYHKVHAKGGNVVLRKIIFFAGGILMVLVGIVALPAPGPGMIIIAIGAGMIAQESLVVAKALDRIEVKGRHWIARIKEKWRKSSRTTKLSAILTGVLFVAGLLYGSVALYTQWRG